MIIIRCDASDQWGMGNLMRCRALAQALKEEGMCLAMVGPSLNFQEPGDADLFDHWLHIPWLTASTENAKQLATIAELWEAKALVIDDPRADQDFQKYLFDLNIKWLQFDGTATKPLWANWVLNALPDAQADIYLNVVQNPTTQLMLGPQYAVLRKEFAITKKAHSGTTDKHILMTFGGGDDRGAIAWCLNVLAPLLNKNIRINIISGNANPRNSENLKLIEEMATEKIEYAIQPAQPWKIISACDLAVMASGTTVHEVNVFNLPMVLMSLVDNQHKPGQAWAKAVDASYLGDWTQTSSEILMNSVQAQLAKLKSDTELLPPLVDGLGASRVAQSLCEQLNLVTVE